MFTVAVLMHLAEQEQQHHAIEQHACSADACVSASLHAVIFKVRSLAMMTDRAGVH